MAGSINERMDRLPGEMPEKYKPPCLRYHLKASLKNPSNPSMFILSKQNPLMIYEWCRGPSAISGNDSKMTAGGQTSLYVNFGTNNINAG